MANPHLWYDMRVGQGGDVPAGVAGAMTWNSADVPSLFSPPRPAQGAVARERERGEHPCPLGSIPVDTCPAMLHYCLTTAY